MKEAIKQLMDEHRAIERMIGILEGMCSRLDGGARVPPEDLAAAAEFIKVFADQCHHGKEEGLLFPAMAEAGMPAESGPIAVMLMEHEEGRRYVKALAEAVARYAEGDKGASKAIVEQARNYGRLLIPHIGKEDNILYPMAEGMLPDGQWEELADAFEKVETQRIGAGRHEQFHRLLDRLEKAYGAGERAESLPCGGSARPRCC